MNTNQGGADDPNGWQRAEGERLGARLRAAIDGQSWEDLGDLIDDHFFALSFSEPGLSYEDWSSVSEDWLSEHPRYRLAAGLTHAAWRGTTLVEEGIERTFTRWVLAADRPAARDVLSLHILAIRRHLVAGRFERANEAAEHARRLIRDADDEYGIDDIIGMGALHIGLARLVTGDLPGAVEIFSEGWRWSMSSRHPLAPYLAGHAALAHALLGEIARADDWLPRSKVHVTTDPRTMPYRVQSAGLLAEALIGIGRLDPSAAATALLQVDAEVETGDLWWVAVHAHARVALLWGDRARAIRRLEADLDAYPSLSVATSLVGMTLRADLSDLHQTMGHLETGAHVLAPVAGARAAHLVVASAVRHLMTQGRPIDALAYLDAARRSRPHDFTEPPRWKVLRADLGHLAREPWRDDAIRAAAQSIFHTADYAAVLEAVPAVYADIAALVDLPPDSGARFVSPPMVVLTPREEQVLSLLASRGSVQEIAVALHVSRNTAKTHLRTLYRKLGVSTREEALQASVRYRPHQPGMTDPREPDGTQPPTPSPAADSGTSHPAST